MIRQDPIDRFREKIAVMSTGCHEWQSTIKRDGYGQFWLNGVPQKAHKVAYEFFVGPIPKGMRVLHNCDNRICVNAAHLRVGTQRDNVMDMDTRGRRGRKKVTRAQDDEIAALYATGLWSQQMLGDKFGICQTIVSKIVRGKRRLLALAA